MLPGVTNSREDMSIRKWNQRDVMSIRKWNQRDVMSMRNDIKEMLCRLDSDIKEMCCRWQSEIKEMWDRSDAAESKMAREMPCFTTETAAGGREVGSVRRRLPAIYSRYVRPKLFGSALWGWFKCAAQEVSERLIVGEWNCRLLDAV